MAAAQRAQRQQSPHVYAVPSLEPCHNGASFLGKSANEEPPMAREPDKSARETGKAKSEATAGSRSGGNDETAGAKSGAPETVELLKTQHRDLQGDARQTVGSRRRCLGDCEGIRRRMASPHGCRI